LKTVESQPHDSEIAVMMVPSQSCMSSIYWGRQLHWQGQVALKGWLGNNVLKKAY